MREQILHDTTERITTGQKNRGPPDECSDAVAVAVLFEAEARLINRLASTARLRRVVLPPWLVLATRDRRGW